MGSITRATLEKPKNSSDVFRWIGSHTSAKKKISSRLNWKKAAEAKLRNKQAKLNLKPPDQLNVSIPPKITLE